MKIMNRNTSPISPFKPDHYQAAIEATEASQYPDEELARFKRIYGQIHGFETSQIELANGSDEWIQKLMIVFGREGKVLTLDPDFFMYRDYANQLGVEILRAEADEAFNFSLEKIVEAIKKLQPRMFIFSNPQNPTGHQFSESDLQVLADAMEAIEGYLVIDEAYIEFGQDYKRPSGDHVIILRTMSKIYGMAGLRIGIMHATGETYDKLTKINHPYPLNNLVLNTASEFLEDEPARVEFVNYQLEARDLLVESLDLVSDRVHVKPTQSNFVFTYGDLAKDLGNFLKEKGYQARFYEEDSLQDVIRYSILAHDEYPAFKEALKEWRSQK